MMATAMIMLTYSLPLFEPIKPLICETPLARKVYKRSAHKLLYGAAIDKATCAKDGKAFY